jgi:hypothetical protein
MIAYSSLDHDASNRNILGCQGIVVQITLSIKFVGQLSIPSHLYHQPCPIALSNDYHVIAEREYLLPSHSASHRADFRGPSAFLTHA